MITLHVRPGEPGAYQTIQEAVSAAVAFGDVTTIEVASGVYPGSVYCPPAPAPVDIVGERVDLLASDFWTMYLAGGMWSLHGLRFNHGMVQLEVGPGALCVLHDVAFGSPGRGGVHIFVNEGVLTCQNSSIAIYGPADEMLVASPRANVDFTPRQLVFVDEPKFISWLVRAEGQSRVAFRARRIVGRASYPQMYYTDGTSYIQDAVAA